MGIKGLWGVLAPFSEKKSLHEVRGQTLAVDLSGWICDSQNVTDYYIQPKLYLRNLFFRTAYLILADVTPIFVLEGDAPELKRDVMAARNAIQFRGAAPKSDKQMNKRPDVGRKRFKGVLKECESLLSCMGVCCVKGQGEAEATCAHLNALGLVDAVISQDSDCFGYGAVSVYRNFSVSNSAGGGALAGSVDCYDARKMFQQNGFGRNKMVALAMLCGCDYGVGACGSSITTTLAFLETVSDSDIIPRLLSWVSDPESFEAQTRWLSIVGRCERCGHSGRTHVRNGCPVCVTHKGCHDTGHKSKVANIKRELGLRSRALTCGMPFPEPKIIKEFLKTKHEDIDLSRLKPSPPSLIQFIKIMKRKLDWSERYCVEKFLPILTKYHLQGHVTVRTLEPSRINKKRTPRGVPSFEIIWKDINGEYEGLIPDDQFEAEENRLLPWTTTERQDLVRQYYPKLVEEYEEATKKPVKEKKPRGRKKKDTEETDKPKRKYNRKTKKIIDLEMQNLSNSVSRMNISKKEDGDTSRMNVSVKVNKLKRKHKTKNQKTLESFIRNKKRKSKAAESFKYSFKDIKSVYDDEFDNINNSTGISRILHENDNHVEKHLQEKVDTKYENVDTCFQEKYDNIENKVPNKFSLSALDFSKDEIIESELSVIVDNIVSEAPAFKTATVNDNLVKLVFKNKTGTPRKSGFRKSVLHEIQNNCSTPRESPRQKTSLDQSNKFQDKINTSHFFDKLGEGDAFEMSLECNDDVVDDNNYDCVEYNDDYVHYNDDYVDYDNDKTIEYNLSS